MCCYAEILYLAACAITQRWILFGKLLKIGLPPALHPLTEETGARGDAVTLPSPLS